MCMMMRILFFNFPRSRFFSFFLALDAYHIISYHIISDHPLSFSGARSLACSERILHLVNPWYDMHAARFARLIEQNQYPCDACTQLDCIAGVSTPVRPQRAPEPHFGRDLLGSRLS